MGKQNSEGEWTNTVLAVAKISDTIVWKLQESVSPTGVRFIGVRKYAVTKQGEKSTKSGFSVPADSVAELAAIHELLSKIKLAPTTLWCIAHQNKLYGRYMVNAKGLPIAAKGVLRTFATKAEAQAFRDENLTPAWRVRKVPAAPV